MEDEERKVTREEFDLLNKLLGKFVDPKFLDVVTGESILEAAPKLGQLLGMLPRVANIRGKQGQGR